MMCSREELCRTSGVLFEKVLVIAWDDDSFGDLGLGESTQNMGVKVDFSMAGLVWVPVDVHKGSVLVWTRYVHRLVRHSPIPVRDEYILIHIAHIM